MRANPRITASDADAIKRYGPLVRAVMLESEGSGAITYRGKSIDSAAITGVTRVRGVRRSTPSAAA